jgi:putative ABC transport system permease protein
MRRTPGFAAVAIITLALAIGANTAIFSVVHRLLIGPLAYREADRLVAIDATREYEGAPRLGRVFWRLDAAERWQQSLHAFSDVTFFVNQVYQRSARDGSDLLEGATVSPSFFSVLGGPMSAGRPFAAADGAAPSIVISDRLARRLFNDPRAAVGAHLVLNTSDYVVIGVAAPEWDIPSPKADVWEPSSFARIREPRCCNVELIGRLKPHVTVSQAAADVVTTGAALAAADQTTFGGVHTSVTTVRDRQLGDGKAALLVLWAAVGTVLVVASANIVNLLIARNVARTGEIAIRQALGASRRRLAAQGLIESGVLAAAGVVGGLAIAQAASTALARVDPEMLPRLSDMRLDRTVVAFAAGLGALMTIATGLIPAIQAAHVTPSRTISKAPSRRYRRVQQLLCAAQLAAALVLLVGATLFGRSLVDLLATDLGVVPDRVVTASINTAIGRPHSADEIAGTMLRVVERVRLIPGVHAAGVGTSLPPDTSRIRMTLRRKGAEVDYAASAVSCTPGYFNALGMRLLKGRFFTDADDEQHPPVIIVSATTARNLFGTDDPIGQPFVVPKFQYKRVAGNEATVVGVVSDVKFSGIDRAAGDQVYWSASQAPWQSTFLAIRTAADMNIAADLRRVVASVDPTIAVSSIRPLEGIIATATALARFRTTLIVAFALVGLAIASIGLYGVVAYSVSQRTTEIGVRVALGATSGDVTTLVLRQGLAMAVLGAAIGLPIAYATTRGFAALLFGVKPTDVLTYAASAASLIGVALLASYIPARRAARVDPIVALRAE